MKIKLILLSTVFLALSSCYNPDYVEDAKVELEVGKQQLIPYQKDQKINFVDSKGNAFDFTVTSNDLKWYRFDPDGGHVPPLFTHETHHYTSYQSKKVVLQSANPSINIELYVDSYLGTPDIISIRVSDWHGYLYFDKNYQFVPDTNGGTSIFHESIVINGKTYNNVIEATMYAEKLNLSNTSVLWNELGLLQIKISDDQIYSINN